MARRKKEEKTEQVEGEVKSSPDTAVQDTPEIPKPTVPREKLIEEMNKLSPLDRLKMLAKVMGVQMNEPNPDCPVCHGNGYTEVKEDGEVQPCMCIFPGFGNVRLNREQRRKLARQRRKQKCRNTHTIARNTETSLSKSQWTKQANPNTASNAENKPSESGTPT